MGRKRTLTAADGHVLGAYAASPATDAIGGLVVIQEIFGVTPHIQRVVDRYAALGLEAIAPQMYDRIEPDLIVGYDDFETGRGYMRRLSWDEILADVDASIAAVSSAGRTGVIGFCWGGTVAHVVAAERPVAAAVSYYGSAIVNHLDRRPRCPIMYHFGAQDASIPSEAIEKIERAHPSGRYFVYPEAGHGFSCEDRAGFDAAAAELAFERSAPFLSEHLAG
jgi:carboxymethylenebutenolidase